MKQRSKFIIVCLLTCIFTLALWKSDDCVESSAGFEKYSEDIGDFSGSGGSDDVNENKKGGWNFGSIFEIGKLEDLEADNNSNDKTVILMWTKYYAVKSSVLMGAMVSGRKYDPSCCSSNDFIVTTDRSLLPNATIVVFYNYYGNLNKKDLPPYRPPGQLWVIFGKESPTFSKSLRQFSNMFNWTMSYRRDSDIWAPYGMTVPLESALPKSKSIMMPGDVPLKEWIANKTEILVGVISHCHTHSKRESLVTALRNASLSVDIFGICGNKRACPRNKHSCDHKKFWSNLASTYKFYFSAENSLCVDYITEKFWRTFDQGIVPVVYGGANYTAVAPPDSFIDVRQFEKPEELTDFLHKLSEDPRRYAKYFEWKRKYKVILPDGWGGFCKLCQLAKQYKNNNIAEMEVSPFKTYKNVASWWTKAPRGSEGNACTKKRVFNL